MRVVIDTNVLISALLKANSGPASIVSLWRSGEVELVVSLEVIDEIARVLDYPKIKKRVSSEEAARFLTLLYTSATIVQSDEKVAAVDADPDDNKFVALALASGAEYIVSGDAHLLDVGTYQDIEILTPAQFIANVLPDEQSESE